MNKKEIRSTMIAGGLILLGVVLRVAMQNLPNIEPITLIAIFGGAYFVKKEYALIVPLAIIAISDLVIGNTGIAMATWSAWAIIGGAATLLHYKKDKKTFPLFAIAGGAIANIFFYLWTNFGVWLQGTMYPMTGEGLIQSYVMGLPFLRNQLLSNAIMIGSVAVAIVVLQSVAALKKSQQPTTK